jgi:hypothetical protein
MRDTMGKTKEWRLEDVLALITSHELPKDTTDETMDLIYHLYKKNPKKEKSLAECASHIYRHFPQFESEEFEEEFHDLCTFIAQTRNMEIRNSFMMSWLLRQKKKYGAMVEVPCLPKTKLA